MSIVAMGASYKTAPIEVRERIAVRAEDLAAALDALLAAEDVDEAVVLSTCNRTEVYVDAKTDRSGAEALEAFFRVRLGEEPSASAFYVHRGIDAVQHVLRVVSSLDSMVLGEAQILGQTKRAYEAAAEARACGEVLTKLFKSALTLGKRVRSETAIGADSVSLSTTAVRAAAERLGGLAGKDVLLVGAGEMAKLAAAYLGECGAARFTVTSRTFQNAARLAAEHGAVAAPFDEVHALAAQADAVFCTTGAQHYVLDADALAQARRATGAEDRALVLVDESLPRNVDPACAQLAGVQLIDLEALRAIVDEGLAARMGAVGDVERMAAEAEEEFLGWMQLRDVVPTIKEMHAKAEAAAQKEVARTAKALAAARGCALDETERQALEALAAGLVKKILHGPTIRLRKEAETADSYYYTGAARYLFGLDAFPLGTKRCCGQRTCEQGLGCAHADRRGAAAIPDAAVLPQPASASPHACEPKEKIA